MATVEFELYVPLRDFSIQLSLPATRTLAITGASGAGKTTILRCLAGLTTPTRGRIAVGHDPWFDSASGLDIPAHERDVGVVFQDHALFPHLDVRSNIGYARDAVGVDDLISRLGLTHVETARPGRLSGGERQRVAVGRALARRPALILLDEPTSSLDRDSAAGVRLIVGDVVAAGNAAVVLVTHDRELAALCERTLTIEAGRAVSDP